jgi:hypothetical protein
MLGGERAFFLVFLLAIYYFYLECLAANIANVWGVLRNKNAGLSAVLIKKRGAAPRGRNDVARGRQTKIGDPRGGWVGQSTKKGWGQIYFFDIFYCVLELPSPRNAQKRDKKMRKSRFWDFGRFFCKNKLTRFFCKSFLFVFFIPSLRHPKTRLKKGRGKTFDFFGKSFRHGFFGKNIFMLFLNSP